MYEYESYEDAIVAMQYYSLPESLDRSMVNKLVRTADGEHVTTLQGYTTISVDNQEEMKRLINVGIRPKFEFRSSKALGTGVLIYPGEALGYLFEKSIAENRVIIKVQLDVNNEYILDINEYRNRKYLRNIYSYMTKKEEECRDNKDLINYIVKNSMKKPVVVTGIICEGTELFKGSITREYTGKAYNILDTSLISNVGLDIKLNLPKPYSPIVKETDKVVQLKNTKIRKEYALPNQNNNLGESLCEEIERSRGILGRLFKK